MAHSLIKKKKIPFCAAHSLSSFSNRKICKNLICTFDIYRLLYSRLYTGWRTRKCYGVSSCSESTDGHQPWPWHNLDRGIYGQCREYMIIPFRKTPEILVMQNQLKFTFHKFPILIFKRLIPRHFKVIFLCYLTQMSPNSMFCVILILIYHCFCINVILSHSSPSSSLSHSFLTLRR